MDMVTTKEALVILRAKGIKVPYPTLALWVREGRFQGAKLEDNPRGAVWYIPRSAVERFAPPERGRPKTKPVEAAPAAKSARKRKAA
jgi:hypothetical protein